MCWGRRGEERKREERGGLTLEGERSKIPTSEVGGRE